MLYLVFFVKMDRMSQYFVYVFAHYGHIKYIFELKSTLCLSQTHTMHEVPFTVFRLLFNLVQRPLVSNSCEPR